MTEIEKRYGCENCPLAQISCEGCDSYDKVIGATEQKAIDHSEEHLKWIIKQHHLWSYEMCHCDNNECCTFKEWIDKAMKE